MNRTIGFLCGGIIILACSFAFNFVSYQISMDNLSDMQVKYEKKLSGMFDDEMKKEIDKSVKSEMEKAKTLGDSVEASADSDTLKVDAIYQIQKYNADKNTTTTDYDTLPEELVGFTKKDMDNYCKDYMEKVPVEEYLMGLQSMGVVSFARDKLIIKKVYSQSKVKYRYYIISIDDEIVVYYGDKKTVYEYTGIETKKLSKEERQALKNGIDVKDEEELFNILENYSS